MGKRKKPDEIKRLLGEAERDLARGLSVADVCRKLGISEATYHRWRQRFGAARARSEEHTSELQSHSDLVCRLLLEKKKKKKTSQKHRHESKRKSIRGRKQTLPR